jgi:hypothetical protein
MVVFVDESRNDGFSADGLQVDYFLGTLRLHIRGPLLPGLMRPVAVVMSQVLPEQQGQVAFAED